MKCYNKNSIFWQNKQKSAMQSCRMNNIAADEEKVCAVYLAVLFYLTIHFMKVIKIIKKRNWI